MGPGGKFEDAAGASATNTTTSSNANAAAASTSAAAASALTTASSPKNNLNNNNNNTSTSTSSSNSGGGLTYNLSSFILHHGDEADSGHYIVYSRHNRDWWRYDDANVKYMENIEQELNCSSDLAQSAYVFLYERNAPGMNVQIRP